jgi:hypothetical protein
MTSQTERLLTDDELARLGAPPREQIAAALEAGDEAGALVLVTEFFRGWRDFVTGFDAWIGAIQEWLAMPVTDGGGGGFDALTAAAATEWDVARHAMRLGITDDDWEVWSEPPPPTADLVLVERVESALRRLHDLGRDRVALALSHVYRRYGVEALERCLRLAADRTILRAMDRDLQRDPLSRVRRWSRMGLYNFSGLRVEESDDAFTIVQDPCGTCGRQLLDGLYGPPLDLAVVAEPCSITWGRGTTPIYRSHVPLMHSVMPIERIGVPWPLVQCPAGTVAGPCRIVLHKDPRAAR